MAYWVVCKCHAQRTWVYTSTAQYGSSQLGDFIKNWTILTNLYQRNFIIIDGNINKIEIL